MILKAGGKVEFETYKDLVQYIKSFDKIECERDISILEEIVASNDLVTLPVIEDCDGEVILKEGRFDENRLLEVIDDNWERVPGIRHDYDTKGGIILSVNIAGIEFEKYNPFSNWRCGDSLFARSLPDGYSDDELNDLFDLYDNVEDVSDLISVVIDEKMDVSEMFHIDYRNLRSLEEDMDEIESQLDELGYDGFYTDWRPYIGMDNVYRKHYIVYGWRNGDDIPYDGFSGKDLIGADAAARCLAQNVGWLPADVVQEDSGDDRR